MLLFSVLFSLLFVFNSTFSARILAIVPTPSYSHQIVFRPLWRELSLRGHQLTVMTTDPIKDPSLKNLTEIDFQFSYVTWNKRTNLNELAKVSFIELIHSGIKIGYSLTEEQFQHPQVQALLSNNSTESYDLVMIESIFPAMAAFAEKYNCPLIQILSFDATAYTYHSIGNPSHPIINADPFLTVSQNPNFLERLTSALAQVILEYYYNPQLFNALQLLIDKHFGNNYSSLNDILGKTSMLFVNTDPILHPIRPLLPSVIQFGGGTHLSTPKPLTKDLQLILDKAKNGAIYFSLGSNVRSNLLPDDVRDVILKTFGELPYIVLWKFEAEHLPRKPDNVLISKWFPQQDLLNHPNIKLFITQGGLQSIEESIYNYIPMIGLPFIDEQKTNVQRIVSLGVGLQLDVTSLEKETFKKTIMEVMDNPKYRNKVKELAELAKDLPMSGLDRAVWWTEYVIRHRGAKHLRSPAIDLPNYQYYLLDVIGFCVFAVLIIGYLIIKLLKLIYNFLKPFLHYNKLKKQ